MPLNTLVREQSLNYTILTKVLEDRSDYEQKSGRSTTRLLKRIPLDRLMDLKVDYAFKQLFGNEKNKEITVVFLNAILQRTGRDRIKDISFSNTESGGEYVDDKQSRLDLLVVTDSGERINVEIQFTNKYNMIKRSIYYWSGTYRNPLQKSMSYKELQPVITINIMNFNLFDQTERFHTAYHLYEDEERFKLTDVMEFHFIEMPKLIKAWKEEKLDPWNDVLARWLLMLGMVDRRNNKIYEEIYQELEGIAVKDKTLRKAFHNWEEVSMTQEQYLAYESRLKRIMDEEAFQREMELLRQEVEEKEASVKAIESSTKEMVKEAEKKEKEAEKKAKEAEKKEKEAEKKAKEAEKKEKEAEKKAKEAKEEVASRLLALGAEIEIVMKSTELPKDKVIAIQRALK